MKRITKIQELRTELHIYRQKNQEIAFVPTMGALHDGHLALVKKAKKLADIVVVSIFVNPKQFGANEDLDDYPRTLEQDCDYLQKLGVDYVYIPTIEEIYPNGFASEVRVAAMGNILCGKFRPGHFNGVCTVVLKLFNQVQPNIAIFGEKDYQQLAIIRKMVTDLDLPIRIESVKTLREKDGLAMSSRNKYLSSRNRRIAHLLYHHISWLAEEVQELVKDRRKLEDIINNPNDFNSNFNQIINQTKKALLASGFSEVDYLELRNEDNFYNIAEHIKSFDKSDNMSNNRPSDIIAQTQKFILSSRIFVAAKIGKVRLIDNIKIDNK